MAESAISSTNNTLFLFMEATLQLHLQPNLAFEYKTTYR